MRYTKMHGAGNSFILIDNLCGELGGEDLSVLALRLCDGKSGPGADGLIVVTPVPDEDMGMLFFNPDGSQGEMCGNGARCLARWGCEHGAVRDPERIRILAPAGEVTARRITENLYEVRLNDPSVIDLERTASTELGEMPCSYVELGNPGIPHAVVEVDESAAIRAKHDENSAVQWIALGEVPKHSTEPWMIEHIYQKLIEKSK